MRLLNNSHTEIERFLLGRRTPTGFQFNLNLARCFWSPLQVSEMLKPQPVCHTLVQEWANFLDSATHRVLKFDEDSIKR